MSTIDLKIEFSGGLELLFDNRRTHTLTLPAVVPSSSATATTLIHEEEEENGRRATPPDVTYLIRHLRTHLLRERPELFVDGDTVYVFVFSDPFPEPPPGL